jgi:nitrous oxidase accessory protein
MSITPAYSSLSTSGKAVITVDDEEGDGDYRRIKDALNYANPGDTIEVYSGTYYEHGLDIVKEGITLQGIPYELGRGDDTGKPFIDGRGMDYVFLIDAKNIIIDDFHIENWAGTQHGIMILSERAKGCTISNNDLAEASFSFVYVRGSNNEIIDNNMTHSLSGISLRDPCTNCLVSGNVITKTETGIELWDSNHNTIIGNRIHNCSWNWFSLDLAGSDFNTIEGNIIENNEVGIHIYLSRFNTIKGNMFENNVVGVYIDRSIGSSIKNNNFIDNELHAQFGYMRFVYSFTNRWNGNYWNRTRILPYPIPGGLIIFPWIQFDWRPAKEPYNIEI